jgi:putative SOS response-associated peptidase YedK
MAGIWYPVKTNPEMQASLLDSVRGPELNYELVSLTTQPNAECAQIHSRMPLLVAEDRVHQWLSADISELGPLLRDPGLKIKIENLH